MGGALPDLSCGDAETSGAYTEYHDRVLLIGVDIGPFFGLGDKDDALALLDELGITYPAGTTSDASVMRDYQVLGTPTTLFLKPNGEIIQRWTGLMNEAQLNGFIETLLEASGSSYKICLKSASAAALWNPAEAGLQALRGFVR